MDSTNKYWINLHYACFGVETKNDKIINAAPIGKWMIGKTLCEIKPWLRKKKAIVKKLRDETKS